MNKPKHEISSDENMNNELKSEVQGLRGAMLGQAEKVSIPERFTVLTDPDRPQMHIMDTVTGKSTTVPIYAYGAVRQALSDLFE